MNTILLTEQTLPQLKSILMGDSIIRKLLYIQDPSALTSTTEVTETMVNNLITIVPYVTDTAGIENSSESNFIVIYANYIDLESDVEHKVDISIDIFVYKDYFLLNGSKIRSMQLLNRVVDLLENKKLAFAERFRISNARMTNIDNGKTIGYLTNWSIANGTGK